ncbi:MAG: phosphotransferase family protein [Betaproteobacteria bacterium]|nr:phosphotransferase family protein [Betaproteobacteria bacterium]
MSQSFAESTQKYLAKALRIGDLRVEGVQRLAGGISREAWRVDTNAIEVDGTRRSFVFRLDPPTSLLESSRQLEFAMFRMFKNVPEVPVPEAVCVEDDPAPLGAPFIATALLPGVADPGKILALEFDVAGPLIARQMFEILGSIASVDHRGRLDEVLEVPAPEDVWSIQLEHWEKIIHENSIGPMPVTSAAIRRLKREPPLPPKQLSVVHGDYRLGNYLYTPNGIVAILDWEMAHLGDPHEDLAWAFARNWQLKAAPNRVAGFLTSEEAIRIWEQASGIDVDRDSLRWWSLFTHVKAAALWITGAHQFIENAPREVTYAAAAWRNLEKQELWMLEVMGVTSF